MLANAAKVLKGESGQATVEAAFLIPVLLGGMLLLLQPGIVLYDRIVMEAAAAEGCRVLATWNAASGGDTVEEFVRRRLSAVPEQENFHMHDDGCSWRITCEGDESSEVVSVTIENDLRALPLVDFACRAFGAQDGVLTVRVEASSRTQPSWVSRSELGLSPSAWVGAWAS